MEQTIIVNLKLLGKIEIGQKINTEYYFGIINADSATSNLYRLLVGESRYKTLKFIEDTVTGTQILMSSRSASITNASLWQDISQARKGLGNLARTYANDKVICARLEIMQELLASLLPIQAESVSV